ncbi:hypothetical protein C8Q75DRAFT_737304 [Abortiporus biennis]|nr:hypothetical protein C8Q75DRAFT_737304 [Abortiporus biennis]
MFWHMQNSQLHWISIYAPPNEEVACNRSATGVYLLQLLGEHCHCSTGITAQGANNLVSLSISPSSVDREKFYERHYLEYLSQLLSSLPHETLYRAHINVKNRRYRSISPPWMLDFKMVEDILFHNGSFASSNLTRKGWRLKLEGWTETTVIAWMRRLMELSVEELCPLDSFALRHLTLLRCNFDVSGSRPHTLDDVVSLADKNSDSIPGLWRKWNLEHKKKLTRLTIEDDLGFNNFDYGSIKKIS